MATSRDVLAGCLARMRGAGGPERRDRAAAVRLLHDLLGSGFVLARKPRLKSAGELTWMTAAAIHRRCCGPDCAGISSHLSEAAAAVDALRTQPLPALVGSPPMAA